MRRNKKFARKLEAKRSSPRYPKSMSFREYAYKCVVPEAYEREMNKFMKFYGLKNKYLGNGKLRNA